MKPGQRVKVKKMHEFNNAIHTQCPGCGVMRVSVHVSDIASRTPSDCKHCGATFIAHVSLEMVDPPKEESGDEG